MLKVLSLLSFPFITANLDYGQVNMRLSFGQGSGSRQCLNITIIDDSVLEGEESFLLVLRSDSAEVTTRNASVSIQDNDGKSIGMRW